MRIHAKETFDYNMIGCSATFVSSSWHASVKVDDSVMKIVLLMEDRDETFEKEAKIINAKKIYLFEK